MNLSRAILLDLGLNITPNGSGSNPNASVPSGYLKSLFYKQDGTAVVSSLQIKHLQSGSGNWQDLELTYTAPERGYIQVFVANESDQEVFFDQMEVEHIPQLIVQENHYYPFGLELAGLNKRGKPEHKYLYNGKEKQEEFGLNWLDYGARNYEAVLGRWLGIDLKAEKYYDISPYVYVGNMPMIAIDPNGEEIIIQIKDKNQKIVNLKYIPGAKPPKGYRNNKFARDMYKILNTIRKTKDGKRKIRDLHNYNSRLVIWNPSDPIGKTRFEPVIGDPKGKTAQSGSLSVNTLLGKDFGEKKGKMSVATAVGHEIDHAWKFGKLFEDFLNSGGNLNSEEAKSMINFANGQDKNEENRALEGLERSVAKFLGDYARKVYNEGGFTIYVAKDVVGGKGGRKRDDKAYSKLSQEIKNLIEKFNSKQVIKKKDGF